MGAPACRSLLANGRGALNMRAVAAITVLGQEALLCPQRRRRHGTGAWALLRGLKVGSTDTMHGCCRCRPSIFLSHASPAHADLAEVVEERVRGSKGGSHKASSDDDAGKEREYYVHYIDCACRRGASCGCAAAVSGKRPPLLRRERHRCARGGEAPRRRARRRVHRPCAANAAPHSHAPLASPSPPPPRRQPPPRRVGAR